MAGCLTCEEIEQKICDLSESIESALCGGMVVKEGDTTFDYSKEVNARISILSTYRQLYKDKGCASGGLYEFVHVPCVRPSTCVGAACTTSARTQTYRRYRR